MLNGPRLLSEESHVFWLEFPALWGSGSPCFCLIIMTMNIDMAW